MGVRILDEDGTELFEFRAGLGKPLLSRIIHAAKFNIADPEIVLNTHVANFGRAIETAMPRRVLHARFPQDPDDMLADELFPTLFKILSDAILAGHVPWQAWSSEERVQFLKDELYAPAKLSNEKAEEIAETVTHHVERWRRSLSDRPQE